MSGVLVDSFSISGVTGLRDLAYDGTYFYGGKNTNVIYKMNFNSTPPALVSTITCPSSFTVRNICYQADSNALWVGGWATDLSLVNMSGTVIRTIPAATHGLTSTYGTAYDNTTPGGPYIWAINASSTVGVITQINATTGMPTGLTHDCSDVGTAIGGGLWIQPGIVSGTVTLGGLLQNETLFGYDLASVIPDSFDLAVTNIDVNNMVPFGVNVSIKGTINNNGLVPITTYDLVYSIDGGTPVVQNVTGANISSFGNYNFTHATPWTPTVGAHTIQVWVANPNGHADQFTSNDTMSLQVVSFDPAASVPRTVLLETFTSSTCAPCVAGNINMEAIQAANAGKWACLKYQMSWPGSGDPYYTAEGGVRRTYYGVNSVPNQEIDGGFNGNSSSVTQGDFDAAYNAPSFVELDAYMIMDTATKHLTVGVNIDPNIDLPASARMYVAIVERKTTKNVASNGETEFFWVMKKMLPNASGSIVGPMTSGVRTTEFVNYTFVGNYRKPANATVPINHAIEHSVEEFSDLIAVCWIQNYNTKEVYQSCFSSVTLGIADQHPEKMIGSYYPNPATNQVNFNFELKTAETVKLTIVNNLGQEVKNVDLGNVSSGTQKVVVDINDLTPGIYFFKFMIGNTPYTKPVIVE